MDRRIHSRLVRALRFRLERWIQLGPLHQLLFVAALVVVVAVAGGLAAWLLTEGTGGLFDSIWWAFLRLTDPGYLGDDEGAVLRVIATLITVLGYVLFMGSLIAILTQWLALTLRRLESGHAPIAIRGHVVLLGRTTRTAEICRELSSARGRLARFLESLGTSELRIVVQWPDVDAAARRALSRQLDGRWDDKRMFLRSGDALDEAALDGMDLPRASVVVVPVSDHQAGDAERADARAIRILLVLRRYFASRALEQRPRLVVEVLESSRIELAQRIFPTDLEVLSSDAILARIIAQSVRHAGLGGLFPRLLAHDESGSLFIRDSPEMEGARFAALRRSFDQAIPIGLLRVVDGDEQVLLAPPSETRVEPGDQIVFVAARHADCIPSRGPGEEAGGEPAPAPSAGEPAEGVRRVLVLGWSAKFETIVTELAACRARRTEVTLVSRMPIEEREGRLGGLDSGGVRILHSQGDYSRRDVLVAHEPLEHDAVVFLSSAVTEPVERAEARTVLAYELFRSLTANAARRPAAVVEFNDPTSAELFPESEDLLLCTPRFVSHMLAHVALRPQLNAVYEALFVAGGAELSLGSASERGIAGLELEFEEVAERTAASGGIAIGAVLDGAAPEDRIRLQPPGSWRHRWGAGDRLIVLARDDGRDPR